MNSSMKKSDSDLSHIKSKIKVVFLGDQSTGKTSILLRFMFDKFQQGIGATVGIDFMAKNLSVRNYHLRLQLWDTAGQQRFRSLIPSYLKDASVCILVFDLTSKQTFAGIREWIDLCSQNKKQKSIVVLGGNKADLKQRQVTTQEALKLSQLQNIMYFQVSAKNNTNINQMFNAVAQKYIKDSKGTQFLQQTESIKQTKEKNTLSNETNVHLKRQINNQNKKNQNRSGCC